MDRRQNPEPEISLIDTVPGELTLMIDGVQAMQAWERDLMWRSADLLCEAGGDFLEAGLGLGFSARRIASHPKTRSHVVVEKYSRVIELFERVNPDPPPAMRIVHADFFDYVATLAPGRLDGVFFDPELPREYFEDPALLDTVMPMVVRALRPGGRFVPMFAVSGSVPAEATCTALPDQILGRYLRYFDRAVVERRPYVAYDGTSYTPGRTGDAFILCFGKA